MNITGYAEVPKSAYDRIEDGMQSGALSVSSGHSSKSHNASWSGGSCNRINLNATDGWTGETSTAGGHYHFIDLNPSGGEPHNNMPPYLVVYMWQRTA